MATFSNGSLSGLRIVNLKRSEKPNIFMYLKFGVDVSTEQIESFRVRLTEYVKQRPREWIRLIGFRCTRVEADLGFMEYVIIIQHREAWQNLSAVLESKSDVFSFGLQAQKDLNMRYTAPAMPIEMSQTGISSLRSRFGGASSPTVGESFEDKKEK